MEKRLFRLFFLITTLLLLILLLLAVYPTSSEFFRELKSNGLMTIIMMFLTGLFGAFSILNVWTLRKNPTTITISLLGFPRAGKTVYLTVLFDQLQRESNSSIVFNPYGSETIEKISSDLNILARQEWLSKTKQNEVFFYRAFATIKSLSPFKFLTKNYKLEIADFAGESFDELNPSSEKWLHKNDFFQYVIQSDAILFAIDISDIINSNNSEVESLQNSFIAALQILIEKKGVLENRQLKAPVAILFLKSDMLQFEDQEKDVLIKMSRLLDVCKKRCLYFNYYFVSSIGVSGYIDTPPRKLNPQNVTSPIIWVMRKLKGEQSSI